METNVLLKIDALDNSRAAFNSLSKNLDKVSEGTRSIKGRLEDMRPAFQKMAVAGTVAFGAVTSVIGFATKAYQDQERAEARLIQISKQVTKSTDAEIENFKKLAVELQRVGVIADEVLLAGQSQVASFTKSSEVVAMLTDDLADLAVAQYGVEVSQEQAIQTANLLGKALGGQLGALTRTGILVSDEFKTAFEEANTEVERAAVLSQIIQDNYGGLNEAMRATSEGGMQAFKNSLGDIGEEIGKNFTPVIKDLSEKIVPVLDRIGAWIAQNPELVQQITLAALAVTGLVAAIGTLGLILPPIIAGFTLLLGPVGLVIAILGALAFAVYKVVLIMQTLQEDGALIWEGIKLYFKEAVDWILSKTLDPLMAGLQKVMGFIEKIRDGIKSIGGKVGKVVSSGFDLTSSLMSKITPFAEGGIVTRPTLGLVGEAGPEAIIPLSKTGSLAGITINISGNTFLDRASAERMGDLIISKLQLSRAL
jgi:hypothetical protein